MSGHPQGSSEEKSAGRLVRGLGGAALGHHWMLDATGCGRASNPSMLLERALLELPARLGLTAVGAPQLFEHRGGGAQEHTIAGLVLIAQSHLSLHVLPDLGVLHADLFSCCPFDDARALTYLRSAFGFETFRETMVVRGASGAPF